MDRLRFMNPGILSGNVVPGKDDNAFLSRKVNQLKDEYIAKADQ